MLQYNDLQRHKKSHYINQDSYCQSMIVGTKINQVDSMALSPSMITIK